ncbi:putative short-chain dehydrogenase [Thermoascus aurantiacus ATCC 26904]
MTSHPEYKEKTTATEVARAFSDQIRNKNVVITGVAPNSLGEAIALAIASQNQSKLILASRTKEKVEQVITKIKGSFPNVSAEFVELDLASQKSVERAASSIAAQLDTIDVLINNAGVVVQEHRFTEENIELQFGTNHIGHFLLTNLLLDRIRNAARKPGSVPGATRIVNVTSAGHRLSPIRFHDYNFTAEGGGTESLPPEEQPPAGLPDMFSPGSRGYNGWLAYGQSKTANVLFSVYLTHRLKDAGIVSYSVHPGSIWTGLSRHLDERGTETISKTGSFWKSTDQGAAPMLVAAFDPALNEPSEPSKTYLHECQLAEAAPHAVNLEAAERLFRLSEELVGRKFDLSS